MQGTWAQLATALRYWAYSWPVGCSVPSEKPGEVDGWILLRSMVPYWLPGKLGVISRMPSGQRSKPFAHVARVDDAQALNAHAA